MEKSTDIAIIGSGLAAYAAALELEGKGHQVTVVSKAPGATAMSSGAWDLVDSPDLGFKQDWESDPTIRELVLRTLRRSEFHPYAICARHFGEEALWSLLESSASRAVASLPLAMSSLTERNRVMLSDIGSYKGTALVQSSMQSSDLKGMKGAKVLVVGIQGFPNFNAHFIRKALVEIQENQAHPYIEFAGSWDIALSEDPISASLHSVELAHYFDQEKFFGRFCQEMLRYLEGKVYTHLLLPPVLGLENTEAILAALKQISGLQVSETLASPMSVPGWRLGEAIRKYFEKTGVEILAGDVVGYDSDKTKLKSLRIHDEDQRIRLTAKAVILASGKYLGGGIEKRSSFRETVFNLPLYCDRQRLNEQSVQQIATSASRDRQSFLGLGVRVNPLCQALDEGGQPTFDNLFAAGSILGSLDPTHERSCSGVALVSGTVSARSAASCF